MKTQFRHPLSDSPVACDQKRAAGRISFQSGRHHGYSLVDSSPTTKEERFEMHPCSTSAGFWACCGGLSPSCGGFRARTRGLRWCHGFSKHFCPRARFMVRAWSFLCMLSSQPDCRIAPCGALSAPVHVGVQMMDPNCHHRTWVIQPSQYGRAHILTQS